MNKKKLSNMGAGTSKITSFFTNPKVGVSKPLAASIAPIQKQTEKLSHKTPEKEFL